LLADAYGGYNGVVAGNAITRAGCWSHARRKFVEAEKSVPEIAREAVALMDALFAVERQTKDISVSERLELRQKQSVPILAELHRKLLIWKEQLLPKHFMADAVNYTLGQWEALTVFTSDGAQRLLDAEEPSRRKDRSDPGQLDQQLPSARHRPTSLFHATAGESPDLASS
jgi:transposase